MDNSTLNYIAIVASSLIAILSVINVYRDAQKTKKQSQEVQMAYSAAFGAETIQDTSLGKLFNLYTKQIEKYQEETRQRARWSFTFAIFAMVCGFGFVLWGGTKLLEASDVIDIASGSLLSTIGGAVSAFITKTFLNVHKLSIEQLNKYFQQPVINDHIIMAQRIADGLEDKTAQKEIYKQIVSSITKLIDAKR